MMNDLHNNFGAKPRPKEIKILSFSTQLRMEF